MRRRDVLSSALCLTAAASAAEASAPKRDGKEEAVGQYVDLSPVAMPVLDGRRLRNYVFVAVRLNLSPRADALKWREKEPWFRDAMVRAGHRAAFNPPNDWSSLDQRRFKAMMMAESARIAGPGVVTSVTITNQTPQRRMRARQAGA